MTQGDHRTPGSAGRHTDPALVELERQIAETREQLGETVEELAAKADVSGRAKAKAQEAATRVRATAHEATDRVTAAKDKAVARAEAVKDEAAGRATAATGAASGAVHGAGSKAGAKLNHISDDQWRGTYLPAVVGVTVAAGVGTVLWMRYRGGRG
ncbi:DUF3618 domain-containing protein [Streptomyces polygonati]|uniref:DUF3618 domain-containing protein n=1 Tax=Streptomyces polygonati TaxID=1617087 RepID=A0ABV8HTJ7_9ACTN